MIPCTPYSDADYGPYQAARAIRAPDTPERANIPIVAMTANAFEEDKKTAVEAGMNDPTAKPLQSIWCLSRYEKMKSGVKNRG